MCSACGAILPARPIDAFAALGVPRRYALDAGELEARFRDLSRKLHPDRFARARPEARLASVKATTTLNDSYRLLKQPIRRAEALLGLAGVRVGDRDAVAPEFLQEVMELREALEEAREAGDAARLERMGGEMRARREATLTEIGALFAEHEREIAGDAGRARLEAIRDKLVALRYFDRFLDAHAGQEDEGF